MFLFFFFFWAYVIGTILAHLWQHLSVSSTYSFRVFVIKFFQADSSVLLVSFSFSVDIYRAYKIFSSSGAQFSWFAWKNRKTSQFYRQRWSFFFFFFQVSFLGYQNKFLSISTAHFTSFIILLLLSVWFSKYFKHKLFYTLVICTVQLDNNNHKRGWFQIDINAVLFHDFYTWFIFKPKKESLDRI